MIVPVTEMEYAKGKAVFTQAEDVQFVPVGRDEAVLAAFIRDNHCRAAVLGVDVYSGAIYDALPAGGILLRFGVGIDGLNAQLCRAKGLYAANTPGALDQSVAEHALFLMGGLVRHISSGSTRMKLGDWRPQAGDECSDLKLAVIGLGGIGAKMARMAHQALGMDVLVCQRSSQQQAADRLGFGSVEQMLEQLGIIAWSADSADILPHADVVSLHLPAIAANHGYFNAGRFAECKPGALFINTARGKLVVEDDLVAALESGQIGGAALDVFEAEPYQPKGRDLRQFEQVIMTPHEASNTRAANRRMAEMVIENLRYWQQCALEKVHLVFR